MLMRARGGGRHAGVRELLLPAFEVRLCSAAVLEATLSCEDRAGD